MHCEKCGAPLNWDGYQPVCVCDYCRSIQSLEPDSDSLDRLRDLETSSESSCPRCGWPMGEAALDGVKVDCCHECGGVLIQGPAFASIVRRRRAGFRNAASQPRPLDLQQLKIVIDCPCCQKPMEPHAYCGPGNVVIDSCDRCELVWLDAGELRAIEQAPGSR